MQRYSIWREPLVVVAGFLLVVGMLAVCRATPGCFLNNESNGASCASTPNLGEKEMLATNTRQQVQHASDSTFRELVLASEQPVLVDFYADWCRPCQRLAPILEELASENPGAKIVKVNVDRSPALAIQYRVNSIPSLKLFKNGKVANEMVGLVNKNELQALLAQ
jgi:thioredoxin 1